MRYKVIQWATGTVGRKAVQGLAARKQYEIVAAKVYDPAKAGRDLGEICGIGPIGVKATIDKAQIFATEADCVLYMASGEKNLAECHQDVCDLLASGKNVIAVAVPFIYPKGMGAEFADAISLACEKGHSTFHGLGVMPGFVAEIMPVIMTRLSHRVDQIIAYETLVYDTVESKELMFDVMGFGFRPDDPTPLFSNPEVAAMVWKPSALLVADALGIKVDEVQPFRNTALTPVDLTVAAGIVRKGTVAATNFGVRIISDGKPVLVFQHYTRLDPKLAPDWPSGDGWTVIFEGVPSMTVKVNVGTCAADHNDDAYIATAMHAIHAIPYVVAAKPGILSLGDVIPVLGADTLRTAR